ncbi:putative phytosulfokines 6 isoform X3 [Salvia hispanica]|uniref:putative phytosulfokines 6 isoform X3 n=1 Tax=Salvia hispanica TaxID=49212 RepID=UPI002009021A|nr:putative phytosulfokines 6 isoform X3 [Salvia hispanica]
MNSNFHKLLLILLVFSTATASARKMASTKAAEEVDQQIKGEESNSNVASVDSFDLMGMEECGNGETECLMRRAVSEARLDYIYTEKKGN